MKKLNLITLSVLAALSTASCKNNDELVNGFYLSPGISVSFSETVAEVDLKRGYELANSIGRNDPLYLERLNEAADLGMELVLLPKYLNQYNEAYAHPLFETETYDHEKYFLAYRARGDGYLGADGSPEEFVEFSADNNVTINPSFLELSKQAVSLGFQPVFQMNGVPVQGADNGTVTHLHEMDWSRYYHEQEFSFYSFLPLPTEAATNDYAAHVFAYIKRLNDELTSYSAELGNSEFSPIWLGNQEPAMSAGFEKAPEREAGKVTTEGLKANLYAYAKVWKPLADQLEAEGLMVGGIELSANTELYETAVDALNRNSIPVDYFVLQSESGAVYPAVMVEDALNALADSPYDGTKLLLNRYDFTLLDTDAELTPSEMSEAKYNSAVGMVNFFNSELALMKHSDQILGYTLVSEAQDYAMMDEVLAFINEMPSARKPITDLGDGLGSFAFADDNGFFMVIWNASSSSIRTKELLLGSDFPENFNSLPITVRKGSGKTITDETDRIEWNPEKLTLDQILLRSGEFVMIRLAEPKPAE